MQIKLIKSKNIDTIVNEINSFSNNESYKIIKIYPIDIERDFSKPPVSPWHKIGYFCLIEYIDKKIC